MSLARIIILGIVVIAAVAGIALYHFQVHAFYDRVDAEQVGNVQLTSLVSGEPEPIPFENFSAIDSDSSPIRFRACFDVVNSQAMLSETFVPYDGAVPLNAPPWFDCFDAETLGNQLETGSALAFLGVENIQYGIDRIVAVTEDGRGYAWHQINRCGEVVFDGNPAPEDCPTPPEAQ